MRQGNILIPAVVTFFAVAAFLLVLNFAIPPVKKTAVNGNANTSSYVPAPGSANVNEMVVGNTNVSEPTNASTDPTAGWKTYESKPLGFKAKHPAAWVVSECGETYVSFDTKKHVCDTEYISGFNVKPIDPNEIEKSVQSTKNTLKNPKETQITIDGKASRRLSGTGEVFGDPGWYQDFVYVTIGNSALYFHYLEKPATDPPNLITFENLLGTVTFSK